MLWVRDLPRPIFFGPPAIEVVFFYLFHRPTKLFGPWMDTYAHANHVRLSSYIYPHYGWEATARRPAHGSFEFVLLRSSPVYR